MTGLNTFGARNGVFLGSKSPKTGQKWLFYIDSDRSISLFRVFICIECKMLYGIKAVACASR